MRGLRPEGAGAGFPEGSAGAGQGEAIYNGAAVSCQDTAAPFVAFFKHRASYWRDSGACKLYHNPWACGPLPAGLGGALCLRDIGYLEHRGRDIFVA